MRLPSVMEHSFSQVPHADISRSSFNRSHGCKTTFDAGWLIPIYLDEALPGDTFNLKLDAFCRLATPIKPVMDNLYMDTFWFAVPYRLVWQNWHKFNGAQDNPGDSTSYLIPTMPAPAGGFTVGSLADYFGLPIASEGFSVSALPFRCYSLIYNEWFRDQNLQNAIFFPRTDGPDSIALYSLQRRGKRHDYFTSCLPWPQKGTQVTIPLGTSATVRTAGGPLITSAGSVLMWRNTSGAAPGAGDLGTDASSNTYLSGASPGTAVPVFPSNLYADLTTATAASINAFRQAFQIQRMYERDARGGTRLTEIIKSHFGVTSDDARLQRPEYLGGGSTPVVISPVAKTASTDGTSPQGNLAAIGTSIIQGHGFTKSFTEHCFVIGLVSVRADLTYQQRIDRMWSRSTRFDFYWPALAMLGEQPVYNKEIWMATGVSNPAVHDAVFGYQEKDADYRYKQSQITGLFRSDVAGSLDIWHLSQDFDAQPALNATFIQEDPPIDRVIATPAEPHFLFDGFIHLTCARPMPVFGVPGMIDHF